MKIDTTGNPHVITATPAELFELVMTKPANPRNRQIWSEFQNDNGYRTEWRGGATSSQADAMRDWPQGRKILERIGSIIPTPPACESIRRKRAWSIEGDEFSRERFELGYHECWQARKKRRVAGAGRIVKMTLQYGGIASVDAEDLAWTGATALAIVDRLEDAGYRVEVESIGVAIGLGANHQDCIIRVPTKAPEERLDIDRLLLVTACPTFYRYHTFRAWSEMSYDVTSGMGRPQNVPAEYQGEFHIAKAHSFDDCQKEIKRLMELVNGGAEVAAVA